jgi:hypothetical protein
MLLVGVVPAVPVGESAMLGLVLKKDYESSRRRVRRYYITITFGKVLEWRRYGCEIVATGK